MTCPPARVDGYAPISDYGFLSDCRSSALISSDGAVEWLCWPRFDSPSIFGAILDDERGGSWTIRPTQRFEVERSYLPATNVVQSTLRTASGAVRVTDWLHKGARQALCRLVIGLEGEVELDVVCDPRPGYGAGGPVDWDSRLGYLVCDVADDLRLILDGMGAARERQVIGAGDVLELSLGLNRPGPSDLLSSLRRTVEFWQGWAEDLQLPAAHADIVRRSALVLKGLQYEPSGAILAAATTSLPETIGGERNYDYRFSWLRDATFTLYALRALGKTDEAQSWFDWLKSIVLRTGSAKLQIMYGIGGEAELPEAELGHLEGHRRSAPVRIGNAAAAQRQLDVYGEMLDAIWLAHRSARRPLSRHRWLLVCDLAARAVAEWRGADEGIWEVRGAPQHFVYSKVMCWVALDRAVKLARENAALAAGAPVAVWAAERDEIRAQVFERGWDEQLGAFAQAYGSGSLDASNLLMAQVGFIGAGDERFVGTVRAIQRDLTRGGLVDRYKHEHTDDGFDGQEGTFTICSLWLCIALIQIGAAGEAAELFARVVGHANDLGLMSEELTPDGEQLGNYPQAFTHLAIIAVAFALDRDRRRREADPAPS